MNDTNNTFVASSGDGSRQPANTHDTSRQDGISEPLRDIDPVEIAGQEPHSPLPRNGPNDVTRHSRTNRDPSSHNASGRDNTRDIETGRDSTRHDGGDDQVEAVTEPLAETVSGEAHQQENLESDGGDKPRAFADWVDIETTCDILREEGVTRTIRTIQRMCKRGDLVARLVPTENGTRYLVERGSIHEFVERHNQMMPSGPGREEVEGNIPVGQSVQPTTIQSQPSGDHDRSHMQEIIGIKDDQITFLKSQLDIANKQIEMKDEQINTMLERDHETNVLIQNLQKLMALPEAGKRSINSDSLDISERNLD